MSKAYKCYWVNSLIIDDYKNNNNDFGSLLTEDYRIIVPSDNNLITLSPDEKGVLQVIGTA